MLSFLSLFILLPQLNLSDQIEFLSWGEGYTQGKVTHDQIQQLSIPACPLPTGILVVSSLHPPSLTGCQHNTQMIILLHEGTENSMSSDWQPQTNTIFSTYTSEQ